MRFHIGPPPEDPSFDPGEGGWTRLREPRPGLLMVMAVLLGMALAAGLAFVWSLMARFDSPTGTFSVTITAPRLLGALLTLGGFVCLHELLHVLPAASSRSSSAVVLGFWPRHLAPYVACTGALSREAQLLSGSLPLLLLTALPFAAAVAMPSSATWMAALSIANVIGSAADVIMLVLLIRQVPRGAQIRSQGYETWWRSAV